MTETTVTEVNEDINPVLEIANTKTAWRIVAILIIISISLFSIGAKSLGVIIFCGTFIISGFNLKEIKDPDVAFLFRFGKLVGQLKPGVHLGLPLADSIEEISQETQKITRLEEPMYTSAKTGIALDMGIYYVLTNLHGAIRTRRIIEERVKDVVLSKIKGFVGQSTFEDLLQGKNGLEKKIIDATNADLAGTDSDRPDELKDDGYTVIGVEISNIIEQVSSVAAKKKTIGSAEADVDGKKAEAVASPLKDNYPAAIVMAANVLAGQIGEKLETLFKGRKPTQETPTTEGSDTT